MSLKLISSLLLNKYLLASSLFAVWMLFFDRNDLFTQLERKRDLQQIEESKQYFAERIAEGKKFTSNMRNNAQAVEKFVREKYLMKRDNEDLFLIEPVGGPIKSGSTQ